MDLSARTRECLKAGLQLFDAEQWWEAHERWEEAWNEEDGHTRLGLQGLIQLAAALHKGVRMSNPRGMATLFERAAEKLGAVAAIDSRWAGLDLAALVRLARDGEAQAQRWGRGEVSGFGPTSGYRIGVPGSLTPPGSGG